jgi:AmiR/NasT family two-component response regulator
MQVSGQTRRVLVANESLEELEPIAQAALGVGQEVVARVIDIAEVGRVAAEEHADVALVGLETANAEHALDLIGEIVEAGVCPVIVVLGSEDPEFLARASERGVYAYVSPVDPEALRSAIDIALERFGELERLEGSIARRGAVERAKGIIMERYQVDEQKAFELLRRQARSSNLKLVDAADVVAQGHRLLPKQP